MPDDDWRTEALMASSYELGEKISEMYPLITGILDGSITDSRWNGYGASLVIRELIFVQVAMDRWRGEGWRNLQSFLVQAQYMMVALGERIEKPKGDEGKKRMNVMGKERTPKSSSQLICRSLSCGRRPGFTNIGTTDNPWWVCGNCRRPTEGWFISQGDAVLNMFREGPLSGMVYDSMTVLTDHRLANLVLGYKWTPEILVSPHTGRSARVWLYVTETPDSVTSNTPTVPTSSPLQGALMTAEAPAVPDVPTPDPTETPAPAPAPAEPVDVSDLLAKRNALKLSRTTVAAKANITVAQLYRIEQGGKRTTANEATKVREALAELEAEQPAPAAATEGETPANPA